MIEIRNAAGEVTYRNSFITDLPTDRDTVVGRARWKIENESFKILKTRASPAADNLGICSPAFTATVMNCKMRIAAIAVHALTTA
jgi:hypothetical protein